MKHLFKFISKSAAVLGLAATSLHAQNENFKPGDLVLFFQKEGGDQTVYANLGDSATLFRKAAAGPQDGENLVRFLDISAELTSTFGAGWASDATVYAGAAAAWGTSVTNAIALQNGDPHRTIYITKERGSVGTIGEPGSNVWDLSLSGNTAMTSAASGIMGQSLVLETQYATAVAVAPVETSQIDDQNPFLAPGIQGAAMGNTLEGGIQQAGAASSFGTMGPAGTVEYALDLYRVVALDNVAGMVAGELRIGSYEGTITVDASGMVSFIVQQTAPAPEIDMSAGETPITAGNFTQDFGTVSLGANGVEQTFTITNSGNSALTGLSVSKDGSHAADFAVSNLAATTLDAGASTSFTVTFNPNAIGTRTARIRVASNDVDENPFDIGLTGESVLFQPEIEITTSLNAPLTDGAAKLSFGNVNKGSTSPSQVLIIKNTGNTDLTGLVLTKSGPDAGDFVVSGPAQTSIPAGASTTLTVAFKPRSAGSLSATLLLASNDADENPFNISVSGKGVNPAPEIDVQQPVGKSLVDGKNGKNFGIAKVGKTGRALTFTIKNRGNATLSGLAFSMSGANAKEFKLVKPTKTSVAAGASLTFKVTFKPSAKGGRSALLKIKSNDANENPFDIKLTGKGE